MSSSSCCEKTEISFIEATPRYAQNGKKQDKFTLQIELTDFSVYYTQGAMEAAIANLKEGKSQVVCETGQLYKIAKDKQGVLTRKNRDLELTSAPHTYTNAGRYTVAVKVIDIFGNDTMTLVPVNVG